MLMDIPDEIVLLIYKKIDKEKDFECFGATCRRLYQCYKSLDEWKYTKWGFYLIDNTERQIPISPFPTSESFLLMVSSDNPSGASGIFALSKPHVSRICSTWGSCNESLNIEWKDETPMLSFDNMPSVVTGKRYYYCYHCVNSK